MKFHDTTNTAWDELYSFGGSSRFANEGDIGIYYRLPKFLQMFKKHIPSIGGMKILEIGGGAGEMKDNLSAEFVGQGFHYVITEYSPNAVASLLDKYANDGATSVEQADAQALPFGDKSFDLVMAYDVMHHVANPEQMAQEMLRVSRQHIFMCEACGLSLIRKVTEMTKDGKNKGETSYTPNQIRTFFEEKRREEKRREEKRREEKRREEKRREEKRVLITPFYFFVPPKIPKRFMLPFVAISEIGQRVPLLRWQSQSMAVYINLENQTGGGNL